ncbi:MAG: extracellular solute-binding protein [Clostridiales bacterium]|nr:extracellular solute-binding protein [Clostridiales bacterium]
MSKKTWSTILVVVLVVAAAVGIYFATKPAPAAPVEASPTPEAVVVTDVPATEVPTEAPTETPTEVPATEAPTQAPTEVPVTAVPAAEASEAPVVAAAEASEAPVVAAAVAAAVDEVKETVETAAAATEEKVEEVAAATEEKVEEVAAAAEAKVEEAVAQVMPAADKAKAAIWHTFTKGQEEYLAKAVAGFNASQDKYEIELLSQPYDGFLDSVKNSVIAGVGPDIIFNYASEAASYVKGGYLADLSQYIYDEEIGIKDFEGSLVDGVMNGEVKAFEDGGIHYLPAYTTGPILFYNKTLFDELKIAVPTTWEEMEAAAKTIKEQKGIAALGCDSLTDLVQMFIMETPGAGYIDVANKAVLFDTPEVRAKIQWLVDMVKNGYFLVKSTGNYFSEDFNAGIVASYIGSSAGYPYITPADGKFEFAMAPVPAATWYPSWNRGPIVFYYKDDARAQAAYEFVKYFISADVNAGWVEAVTALAPYAWTKETDAYKAYVAQDTLAAQALNAVAENLDVAGSLPAVEGANVVRNALKAAIEKAALGDMTVDEAWTEAVTVSNAALQGK